MFTRMLILTTLNATTTLASCGINVNSHYSGITLLKQYTIFWPKGCQFDVSIEVLEDMYEPCVFVLKELSP